MMILTRLIFKTALRKKLANALGSLFAILMLYREQNSLVSTQEAFMEGYGRAGLAADKVEISIAVINILLMFLIYLFIFRWMVYGGITLVDKLKSRKTIRSASEEFESEATRYIST